MPQKPENIFPKFAAGDPASKFLDHKILNSLTGSVSNLSQRTIGQPRIDTQSGEFRPPILPGAEIRLGKVLDVQSASGQFKSPSGKVNVLKMEVIDALFGETVGEQDVVEQDASSAVIYAAADPGLSVSVGDLLWMTKWSSQWWILSSGTGTGGSGAATIKFEVLSYSSALGQGANGCDYVDAEVKYISCDYSGVAVGDTVRVWDPDYCYFNLPITLLDGLKGTAQLMDNAFEVYDVNDLVDCEYEVFVAGACRWMVTSVCCAEEYEY